MDSILALLRTQYNFFHMLINKSVFLNCLGNPRISESVRCRYWLSSKFRQSTIVLNLGHICFARILKRLVCTNNRTCTFHEIAKLMAISYIYSSLTLQLVELDRFMSDSVSKIWNANKNRLNLNHFSQTVILITSKTSQLPNFGVFLGFISIFVLFTW